MTLIYLMLIWLLAFLFTLPIILSVELISFDDVNSCDSNWTEATFNSFFVIKFFVAFIIPSTIILFSSIKLVTFLIKSKKMSNLKSKDSEDIKLVDINSEYSSKNINSKLLDSSTRLKRTLKKPIPNQISNGIKKKAIKIVLSIVLLFFIQFGPLWVLIYFFSSLILFRSHII